MYANSKSTFITGQTHPTNKSSLFSLLILALFCAGGTLQAQDTNTAPAVRWDISDAGKALLAYIDQHATVESGYGWNSQGQRGVLLKQGMGVVSLQLKHTETQLQLIHANWFKADNEGIEDQIGIGIGWRWFGTQPVQTAVSDTPVVRKIVFLNVSEIHISPYVGYPTDELFKGNYDYHNITYGISAGFRL